MMKITAVDYEVINQYAGYHWSWNHRINTSVGAQKHLEFAKVITSMAIAAARYESRVPSKGDKHG